MADTSADRTTLSVGSKGEVVREWQRIVGAKPDGDFGTGTERATKVWQAAHGLVADGVVGSVTWAAAAASIELDPTPPPIVRAVSYPFVQAKNYTRGRYGTPISVVVIHTMESQEKPSTARNVALWFASESAPKASAHYCVDPQEVVQCVRDADAAWGAPGANRNGIHIEHAGSAKQTPEQWADPYSEATLRRSAILCSELCSKYGVAIKRIGPEELASNARGICGHVDVTNAFKRGDHTDPGKNFPWSHYIQLVMAASGQR